MALNKNVAGQYAAVFAWDTGANAPKTGDAAQITAYIDKDTAGAAATNDTNPTEADATNLKGIYYFTLTQAETNADLIVISAVSSTTGILLDPVILYAGSAALGAGAITFTYTLREDDEDTGDPIAAVDVWVTTDEAGSNVIARGTTNSSGSVSFLLDAGNNYMWRNKPGWSFDNPDLEVISA